VQSSLADVKEIHKWQEEDFHGLRTLPKLELRGCQGEQSTFDKSKKA
jgi:hypothetical protein